MFTKWKTKENTDHNIIRTISADLGIPELTAELLVLKGVKNTQEARDFLYAPAPHDPYLLKDMDKAVDRIKKAVERKEKIAIYGDYDVDGITSSFILQDYFYSFEGIEVDNFLPSRDEGGYGLNNEIIDKLASKGYNLIVTVDNGVTAIDEIAYAKSKNIDVVVTDHHQPGPALPDADAIVNPHQTDCPYPFKELAGVGVVFKLVCALTGDTELMLQNYSDILALGTIADAVTLENENRYFVIRGLDKINRKDCNIGLQALLKDAYERGKGVRSTDIAYSIAPKLNATGRIDNAMKGLVLLKTLSYDEALAQASEIERLNAKRKTMEVKITEEVVKKIDTNPNLHNSRVLVVCGKDWHHGILGIVAAKIVEKYEKPCVLLSYSDGDTVAKGSARSYGDFNIYDALTYAKDTLATFGGHAMAAGLSVDLKSVKDLYIKINQYARLCFPRMPEYCLDIAKVMQFKNTTVEAVQGLDLLEPFGQGNPKPLFGFKNVLVLSVKAIGSEKNHTKIEFVQDDFIMEGLIFNAESYMYDKFVNKTVNIAATVEVNEFRGIQSVNLFVKDITLSEINIDKVIETREIYEQFYRNELPAEYLKEYLPVGSADLRTVLSVLPKTTKAVVIEELSKCFDYNVAKFKICLDILSELRLLSARKTENFYYVTVYENHRVDLSTSKTIAKIRKLKAAC